MVNGDFNSGWRRGSCPASPQEKRGLDISFVDMVLTALCWSGVVSYLSPGSEGIHSTEQNTDEEDKCHCSEGTHDGGLTMLDWVLETWGWPFNAQRGWSCSVEYVLMVIGWGWWPCYGCTVYRYNVRIPPGQLVIVTIVMRSWAGHVTLSRSPLTQPAGGHQPLSLLWYIHTTLGHTTWPYSCVQIVH